LNQLRREIRGSGLEGKETFHTEFGLHEIVSNGLGKFVRPMNPWWVQLVMPMKP